MTYNRSVSPLRKNDHKNVIMLNVIKGLTNGLVLTPECSQKLELILSTHSPFPVIYVFCGTHACAHRQTRVSQCASVREGETVCPTSPSLELPAPVRQTAMRRRQRAEHGRSLLTRSLRLMGNMSPRLPPGQTSRKTTNGN